MTWYLAGPMTAKHDWNREAFQTAEKRLRDSGMQVVSPFDYFNPKETWNQAMRRCVRLISECDGIILLEGWESSRGAGVERSVAEGLDMVVVEYENLWSD